MKGQVGAGSNCEHTWDKDAHEVDVNGEDLHVSKVMNKEHVVDRLGEAWLAPIADFDLLAPLEGIPEQGGTSSRLNKGQGGLVCREYRTSRLGTQTRI